jgi:hypothetical protein
LQLSLLLAKPTGLLLRLQQSQGLRQVLQHMGHLPVWLMLLGSNLLQYQSLCLDSRAVTVLPVQTARYGDTATHRLPVPRLLLLQLSSLHQQQQAPFCQTD